MWGGGGGGGGVGYIQSFSGGRPLIPLVNSPQLTTTRAGGKNW